VEVVEALTEVVEVVQEGSLQELEYPLPQVQHTQLLSVLVAMQICLLMLLLGMELIQQ